MKEQGIVQTVQSNQFETLIRDNPIIFLDFWASWCAPCKQFSVVFEKVAASYPDIFFGKINIEKESELAEVFQIQSIPHLIVFKQEIVIYSETGSMPESTLKELVEQALTVDISDIRQGLEEENE